MATGKNSRDGSQSAIAAATRALNEAAVTLGDALRSASTAAATTVSATLEKEVAQGLRTAARTVDDVAAGLASRPRRRDRTRTDLLVAAATLFAEKGYGATSVDDIASAAGYTKGAVYSHFGSKSNLFLAVFEAPSTVEALEPPDHGTPGALPGDETGGVDRCVTLTHELMLFAHRTPESRDEAAALLSQFIEAGVERTLAATASVPATGDQTTVGDQRAHEATERRAALDDLVVSVALHHTLSLLRSAGAEQIDDTTARRILTEHTRATVAPEPGRRGQKS